ncbi:hypothetical protein V2J09_014087 [Rumex salicifolius]
MSCLVPQFKCQPDTFYMYSKIRPPNPTFYFKHKSSVCIRVQCIVSTAPSISNAETAVLERMKLQIPSLGGGSNVLSSEGPLTYLRMSNEATIATETLINCKEAVIAAAAAEAVALARAAVKFAKDAAVLAHVEQDEKSEAKSENACSGGEISLGKNYLLLESEQAAGNSDSLESETSPLAGFTLPIQTNEHDDVEPTIEELEILQSQLSESTAVRSTRQVERKAKRAKAAEKAAISVPVKTISTRKKRPTSQEVKYSDPLRYLRGSSSGSRLLTASEEQELSVGVQDLLKLERLHKALKERGDGEPTFSQWATAARLDQKVLRKRLNYGIQCKDKMIKSNIRLVISIAKKYQGSGMSLQDLVQEGCRGLVRGTEKFDASKGFKFSTYAHWWIKQAVRKSLTEQSRTIRLPFHMVEASYRVREARKQLYSENGRHPDNQEVAEATGLSMKRLNAVLMTPKAPRSLDQKFGINESLKPSEVIADPDAETSEDLLIKQFMKLDIEKVLDTLTQREKQVIKWRFGMGDGRTKTLQEIGELMGVSRERIRQIESSAFRKLTNKKRTKHLQQYLYI